MAKTQIKSEPVLEKSWVELYEEEKQEEEALARKAFMKSSDVDNCNVEIKQKKIHYIDENAQYSIENVSVKTEIKIEKEEEISEKPFSYASAVKSSPINGGSSVDNIIKTENVTYTPSKEDFPECIDSENSKGKRFTRRKLQKEFLQEDLSLSSHLDVIHMISPCKTEKDVEMLSPTKDLRKTITAKRKMNANPFASDNTKKVSDDILMPSPTKVTRSSAKKAKIAESSNNTRKRQREDSSTSAEDSNKESKYEKDEAVLVRRQKQIDYGKNTIGYERYRQLVPKDSRSIKHPHTPPKHRKYSRRAWDGLVRVWRQRLHFWDPPSQGGGNSDSLDFGSSLSDDMSSCETASVSSANSQSSTPWKENKRRVRVKRESVSSSNSSNNDLSDTDFTPLE